MNRSFVALACLSVAAGLPAAVGFASLPGPAARPDGETRLVAHEWGTFTSFSGADGVPVGFRPDNSGLPEFVYRQGGEGSKDNRLARAGTVSLETPVVYFYADRETKVSVRVDFPKGWVTEFYPYALVRPLPTRSSRDEGEEARWDVRLRPGSDVELPRGTAGNHYFRARETDAAPLEAEIRTGRGRAGHTETVAQREKFLFYRGVGTFPPPVAVRALGGGKVRVTNATRDRVGGLVLVTVRGGKVGFRPLPELAAGADATATLADPVGPSADLADLMVKDLTAAGLYPKEARAMVRTWEAAWFGEDGTRLLYLVPRAKTDELLPLTVEPKPAEVVRVLVGRHEFLTPEREADAERQVARARSAGAPLGPSRRELDGFGRFAAQARAIAEKRLAAGAARQ